LHLFIELSQGLNAREILADCYRQGVVYTAGDVFFTDGGGANTLRLGFSRVSDDELRRGIEIIGKEVTKRLEAQR
jgi:DNA-binding transcriptional MocR family regulator